MLLIHIGILLVTFDNNYEENADQPQIRPSKPTSPSAVRPPQQQKNPPTIIHLPAKNGRRLPTPTPAEVTDGRGLSVKQTLFILFHLLSPITHPTDRSLHKLPLWPLQPFPLSQGKDSDTLTHQRTIVRIALRGRRKVKSEAAQLTTNGRVQSTARTSLSPLRDLSSLAK
uniref:Uncharacterized protein n=1 Tax=Globodera rostochiensis TaxID=31243 RepID=A0A914GZX0_GLORO